MQSSPPCRSTAASRGPLLKAARVPQYLQSGHLVFGKAGTLLAIAFDPVAVRTSGAAITMIDNVRTNQLNGAVPFAVSSAGLLVYLPGENASSRMSLHRATRAGQTRMMLENRLIDNAMSLSPDGSRVALAINDGAGRHLDRRSRPATAASRFTFGPGSKTFPAWSRDGSRLYYGTTAGGSRLHAVVKAVDGSRPEQTLTSITFLPDVGFPGWRAVIGRAIKHWFQLRRGRPGSLGAAAAQLFRGGDGRERDASRVFTRRAACRIRIRRERAYRSLRPGVPIGQQTADHKRRRQRSAMDPRWARVDLSKWPEPGRCADYA